MKHLPLIVGIALPLIFIALVVAVVYLPTLSIKPAHDFIYTTGAAYYPYGPFQNAYVVRDGKLATDPVPLGEGRDEYRAAFPPLYRYSVKDGTAKQIEPEELAGVSLQPGPSSPDGYAVEFRYSGGGLFDLFGGGSNSGYFMQKDGAAKRLPGLTSDRGWSNDVSVVGWVTD